MSSYNFEIECKICESKNVELNYKLGKILYKCLDCGEIDTLENSLFIFRKNNEIDE